MAKYEYDPDYIYSPDDYYPPVERLSRQRRRGCRFAWLAIATSLAALLLALGAPLWARPLARLIPPRYLVTYAPWLADFAYGANPSRVVPTAQPDASAAELLEGMASEPTAALQSTPTPSQQPEQTATSPVFVEAATPTPTPPPAEYYLAIPGRVYQSWNNCGPATMTMYLWYWGVEPPYSASGTAIDAEAAAALKTDYEDKNVRPDELAAYARSFGFEAIVRENGNLEILKRLIASNIPVMVERGFDPEPDRLGWMGHYALLMGYSDAAGQFAVNDSYLHSNPPLPYDEADETWKHFNRLYIVVYPAYLAETVQSIIGADMDDVSMYTRGVETAQAEIVADPNDKFAWFNWGTNLVALGRYEEAAAAYDQARALQLPWRILWYQFGPLEAYLQTGQTQLVRDLSNATQNELLPTSAIEELYYYMGRSYEAEGNFDAARQQYELALRWNSRYAAAQEALVRLSEGS
jgi:tetratricopeptide (TPR) repeat protein